MQVDSLALRLRPRTPYEAADLGTRLCQSAYRDVYKCYLVVAIPVFLLCMASVEIAYWLPALTVYWFKPWLDRTILFVLARAAFGQRTSLLDLWRAQRQVWWSQLFITLTWRLLSPWRSFTQPVYQLEGLRGADLRARVRQIRAGRTRAGTGILSAFSCAETALVAALTSPIFWFAPQGSGIGLRTLLQWGTGNSGWFDFAVTLAYAATIGFVEPFFVAAGFALYLSRRAELEAWDIEQEFRRAFA